MITAIKKSEEKKRWRFPGMGLKVAIARGKAFLGRGHVPLIWRSRTNGPCKYLGYLPCPVCQGFFPFSPIYTSCLFSSASFPPPDKRCHVASGTACTFNICWKNEQMICSYMVPICRSSFSFVTVTSWKEALNFNVVKLTNFFLCICVLEALFNKVFPISGWGLPWWLR